MKESLSHKPRQNRLLREYFKYDVDYDPIVYRGNTT